MLQNDALLMISSYISRRLNCLVLVLAFLLEIQLTFWSQFILAI